MVYESIFNYQDQNENEIKCVIIDFSALTFIDPLGVEMLKQIIKDFKRKWIYLFLAGCSCKILFY